jgi:hypothetical protein
LVGTTPSARLREASYPELQKLCNAMLGMIDLSNRAGGLVQAVEDYSVPNGLRLAWSNWAGAAAAC